MDQKPFEFNAMIGGAFNRYTTVSMVAGCTDQPEEMELPQTSVGDSEKESVAEVSNLKALGPTDPDPVLPDDSDVAPMVAVPLHPDACYVTLSGLPRSKWADLSTLDDIRRRNKPKEPPKAPERAPFFLPSTGGLNPQFSLGGTDGAIESAPSGGSKVLNFGKLGVQSEFQRVLCGAAASGHWALFMEHLKTSSITSIDLEIRSLDSDGDAKQLQYFLEFAAAMIGSKEQFELVQAYLHLFLKVHGDTIRGTPQLTEVGAHIPCILVQMRWLQLSA